jgi:hypothetical protein
MLELARSGELIFFKIEDASEINKFRILGMEDGRFSGGGFEFFRGLGIIGYEKTFKIWLRKFPRPIFIIAVKAGEVISWVFMEEWEDSANDGMAIWVLRAIETLPSMRKKKIGYKLLMLSVQQCTGYMVTKPLTPEAHKFFRDAGFMEPAEFKKPPFDLSRHPGYIILPPYKKVALIEKFGVHFT